MNLFGEITRVEDTMPPSYIRFDTFGTSLMTLFKVFTGDGWGLVLRLLSGCDQKGFECGSRLQVGIASMYLLSFVVIASFVLLNLVIAVILNNFVEAASDEGLLQS